MDREGWSTVKINFNSGDCWFHGAGRDINYSGSLSKFGDWMNTFLSTFMPDVIFMFGDQRPIHRAAKRVANRLGIPVVCFEEGYIRPSYITMEVGGNNAVSPLRDWSVEQPRQQADPAFRPLTNKTFVTTSLKAIAYYVLMTLGWFRFPYYTHHRKRGLVSETLFWSRNWLRKLRWKVGNLQRIQNLVEAHDDGYFVVALQVHDDLQLRRHGEGWTVEKLIETTVASFAKHSHPLDHLVFKGHPMDRGHVSAREFIRKLSAIHNIQNRTHFVDDGSLGLLSRHSRGMVTINSTSAFVSFGHSKPVFAFGQSLYEKLTANGANRTEADLARFWRVALAPNPGVWAAFRNDMVATSLVNGSFYLKSEVEATCAGILARLPRIIADARAARLERAAALATPSRSRLRDAQQQLRPVTAPDARN